MSGGKYCGNCARSRDVEESADHVKCACPVSKHFGCLLSCRRAGCKLHETQKKEGWK